MRATGSTNNTQHNAVVNNNRGYLLPIPVVELATEFYLPITNRIGLFKLKPNIVELAYFLKPMRSCKATLDWLEQSNRTDCILVTCAL